MRLSYRNERVNPDNVPGLDELDPKSVDRVLKEGRVVDIPQGWTPIRAHEPADEAYLVVDGCVEVVRDGDLVARVGRGEFIGEMGLVDGALRSARVTVTEPVVAVAWPRADFQKLRSELDDFDRLVKRTAAERHLDQES